MVAHTCNPNTLGGRGRWISGTSLISCKELVRLSVENIIHNACHIEKRSIKEEVIITIAFGLCLGYD